MDAMYSFDNGPFMNRKIQCPIVSFKVLCWSYTIWRVIWYFKHNQTFLVNMLQTCIHFFFITPLSSRPYLSWLVWPLTSCSSTSLTSVSWSLWRNSWRRNSSSSKLIFRPAKNHTAFETCHILQEKKVVHPPPSL